jgi:hypothetical protein
MSQPQAAKGVVYSLVPREGIGYNSFINNTLPNNRKNEASGLSRVDSRFGF